MRSSERKYLNLFLISLVSFISSFLIISNQISAHASDEHLFSKLYTFGNAKDEKTRVNVSVVSGESIFFLPASVTPDCVTLFSDLPENTTLTIKGNIDEVSFTNGMNLNLNEYCSNGEYILNFIYIHNEKISENSVKFVFSDNIPSIYLLSDNPTQKGREWVESSPDKSNKATGHIILQKSNGDYIHSGVLTQIKGRGNSTWLAVKKPYQIKTEKKIDLLDSGNDKNASKTWVLLTNYSDPSLLRNTISLNLGQALGLSNSIQCMPVDLYYDGEYRGNYLLSEKVEIGNGRVNIADLEELNEEANINVKLEDLPIKTAVTDNGAEFTYCDEMNSPEDISGGYLLEMDYFERALEEVCYFKTTRGQYIVVKSPEYASKEEMNYIATLYQEYEDSVYNDGINPNTGKYYYEYVDPESVAIYYLVNEFSKTKDFFSSSAYLYKDSGEDKLCMGPLWDFDSGYGISGTSDGVRGTAIGLSEYNTEFSIKLLSIEHFYRTVQTVYNSKFRDLVNNALLGDINKEFEDGCLNSISFESQLVNASSYNNSLLWYNSKSSEEEITFLSNYIKERINSLDKLFSPDSSKIPELELEFLNRTYKDVSEDAWYFEDVEKATELHYMNGKGNNFFEPMSLVKRSEVAQVIFNISANNEKVQFLQYFSDVPSNEWYSDAITWVVNKNIMKGYSDGTFKPNNYATREDVIYYLYKTKKADAPNTHLIENYHDYMFISDFAKDAMEWAINEKILIGDDLNNINPHAMITRAEFATILVRFNTINKTR